MRVFNKNVWTADRKEITIRGRVEHERTAAFTRSLIARKNFRRNAPAARALCFSRSNMHITHTEIHRRQKVRTGSHNIMAPNNVPNNRQAGRYELYGV